MKGIGNITSEKGFGIVYQQIMRDKNLSPEAKSIYAYLSCLAGNKTQCYPSVKLMISELAMSKSRFYKHMQTLMDRGIVTTSQSRTNNRWGSNLYTIIHGGTQIEDTQNRDAAIKDTQNEEINNNSFNNNSFKKNNHNDHPCKKKPSKHKYGEYKKVLLTDEQRDRLINELGQSTFEKCVKKLDEYMQETGKRYSDHNLTIRRWVIKAVAQEQGGETYGDKYKTDGCDSTDYYKQFTAQEDAN